MKYNLTGMYRLLVWFAVPFLLLACNDDDERDDTVLDMSYLVGKDWYYNAWLGDKYAYDKADILEVLRFEKNGDLKRIDFSGRREYKVGKWSSRYNEIKLDYESGESSTWDILNSGGDYIRAIVNGQGERRYATGLDYLGNITADVFLVNDFSSGNRLQTHIGVDVRGNNNMREGALLLPSKEKIALENHGYYWNERTPVQGDYFEFDGQPYEARFYLRIGSGNQIKLSDRIYSDNLPVKYPDEVALAADNTGGVTHMNVTWNPYGRSDVYYRVEIFSKDMDLMRPYFVSRLQPAGTNKLTVNPNTAGDVNRMGEMKAGITYTVRLSAILYEPGVDVINDEYGYANVQAVSYFTKLMVWE